MSGIVTVNKDGVTVALRTFALNLGQRNQLMKDIGLGQLRSIYKTFDEEGSPAGSWVPLSASTISRNPKKYGSGHKLLIDKGRLRNSFTVTMSNDGAVIGTDLPYAAVQNFGSRDRTGGPIGPQAKLPGRGVSVAAHNARNAGAGLGKGKVKIVGADGKERTYNRLRVGPLPANAFTDVKAHTRHQNIPARPYMVFRPEDPARIQKQVIDFAAAAKAKAGLGGA